VLVAILIGAEVAGVLGALAAIPVAGTVQILLVDALAHRRRRADGPPSAVAAESVVSPR
jgi:predicted PurR-regulated permease PerM